VSGNGKKTSTIFVKLDVIDSAPVAGVVGGVGREDERADSASIAKLCSVVGAAEVGHFVDSTAVANGAARLRYRFNVTSKMVA